MAWVRADFLVTFCPPRDVKPDNILLDEQGECLELWDTERSVGTLPGIWKTRPALSSQDTHT